MLSATGEARARARRATSLVIGEFVSMFSFDFFSLNRNWQGRFVNEASKKILEKRGNQSAAEAVKPLEAEVAKSVVEEGLQDAEIAADVAKQETQTSSTLVQSTEQPLPITEASTPTSLSKPAVRSKAGHKSAVASDKTEKKRILSSNASEVICIDIFHNKNRRLYKH
jgi:hypothetical protein